MAITANITNEQITASVGETQIDVSVSGGFGPAGPAGAAGPSYTLPTATASVLGGVKIGAGVTIADGVISVSTNYAASSHTHAISDVTDLASTLSGIDGALSGKAAASHAASHLPSGSDPLAVRIGQVLVTEDNGATWIGLSSSRVNAFLLQLEVNSLSDALDAEGFDIFAGRQNLGTAGQVLRVNPAGTSLEWRTLVPADAGAAAVSHAHSASDVNSGTFDIARIPTGSSSTTVSLGNHTHSQLHDRSHAITSSSDHTATAWRAFYSNGSGVITELALGASGTVLTSGGASAAPTFSALPAGGTKTIVRFHPGDNQPPASNFATLDTRNSFLVLEFDAATQESANFIGVIPEGATLTNGLTVRLWWMGDTATSGNVRWGVSFERAGTDNDADSFSSVTEATGAANGTNGIETVTSITATAIDSLVAGDRFRLRVARIAADATNDTMTGDAQLVAVEVQVA